MSKPARLSLRDTLRVIMPASSLTQGSGMTKRFAAGCKALKNFFKLTPSEFEQGNYLGFAATDAERAREVSDAIRSPKVGGLIAGRGGYGCLRIVNQIDYIAIKNNPKPLIGLSDLTILQLAIYQKTGLITFSGQLVNFATDKSAGYLSRLLTAPTKNLDLIPEENKPGLDIIAEGTAEGVLIGGNLYSMVKLAGTGLLPRFDNSILFIEDVDETVDHIDGCLQQLKLAGALYYVAGVVIGNIGWRKDQPAGDGAEAGELMRARLEGMFRHGTPIISGVQYGHIEDSITIPIGARARLDTENRSLTLLEDVTGG